MIKLIRNDSFMVSLLNNIVKKIQNFCEGKYFYERFDIGSFGGRYG